MRRAAPAIALYFLSPLVAEFLLGDFTLSVLWLLLFLAPMYGGGAVLIREAVRRTGRGWPSIALLALAYGVFEEGVTTQSLFNPDYVDVHLLAHGFVPALGIAVPWTIFVLTLHTVWSMSVPIALVEEWTPGRTVPWLRTPGRIVAAVLFVLGAIATTVSTYGREHYFAGWPKMLVVGVIVVLLVVAAFRMPRRSAPRPVAGRTAPRPWTVFATMLAAGALVEGGNLMSSDSAFLVALGVVMMILALAGAAVGLGFWSRGAGWGAWHRFAAAAAGLLTYAWHSFSSTALEGGGPIITPVSHVVFALAAVVLLGFEARRIRAREAVPPAVRVAAGTHEVAAGS
jgi:hypothetical protein